MTPDRFLNCVYTWAVNRIPADKLDQWKFELEKPLPGRERVVSDADQEADAASFMGLMAQVSGQG